MPVGFKKLPLEGQRSLTILLDGVVKRLDKLLNIILASVRSKENVDGFEIKEESDSDFVPQVLVGEKEVVLSPLEEFFKK